MTLFFLLVIQKSSHGPKHQLLLKGGPQNVGIRYKKGKPIFLKTLSQDAYSVKPVMSQQLLLAVNFLKSAVFNYMWHT